MGNDSKVSVYDLEAIRPEDLHVEPGDIDGEEMPNSPVNDEAFTEVAMRLREIADSMDSCVDRRTAEQSHQAEEDSSLWTACKTGLKVCVSAASMAVMLTNS